MSFNWKFNKPKANLVNFFKAKFIANIKKGTAFLSEREITNLKQTEVYIYHCWIT